jgi:hypothetical protein
LILAAPSQANSVRSSSSGILHTCTIPLYAYRLFLPQKKHGFPGSTACWPFPRPFPGFTRPAKKGKMVLNDTVMQIRSTRVNTLGKAFCTDGNSWLENLHTAIVPYPPEESEPEAEIQDTA